MDDVPFEFDSPCPVENIEERRPEGWREDYCDECDETVHNLSQMSAEEAGSFYEKHRGGEVCIYAQFDEEGAVIHRESSSDGPSWLGRSAPRLGAVALAAGMLVGCEVDPSGEQPDELRVESAAVEPIAVEESVARLRSDLTEAVGAARRRATGEALAVQKAESVAESAEERASEAAERTAFARREAVKRRAREQELSRQLQQSSTEPVGQVESDKERLDFAGGIRFND